MNRHIAVIRIRGSANLKQELIDTFRMLCLYKKNTCAVVQNTDSYVGMLKKIKDYATWGEIDEETFKSLLQKRGKLPGSKPLTSEYLKQKLNTDFDNFAKDFFNFKKNLRDIPGLKLFFRLTPPKKGFERQGVKTPFSMGGALGYRKEKINDLIQRMV